MISRKTRTIFTVVGFDAEYLQVINRAANNNEVIFIPLHTLSDNFINKVIKGLACWEEGVLFFAKIEEVPGFTRVYKITNIEENIQPVPTWEELIND